MEPPIQKLAEEWLRLDKDPKTRDEIYRLLVRGDKEELERRLRHRIAFGTAGLRAPMYAGFSGMNSLTVLQASQGLAAYLLETQQYVQRRGIVVGRDARHNSRLFAKLAAAVFAAKGIRVWWYEDYVHTPLVPFGVTQLNAAAGVMITASHNPAQDNGYKVYWSNGCQIIPPHDAGIAASIDKNLEPIVTWDASIVDHDLQVEGEQAMVQDAYFRTLSKLIKPSVPLNADQQIKFVYTPMHGVGLPYVTRAVRHLGLESAMVVVQSQAQPDPDFPTVKFPNPEEKGALDLAFETADAESISMVLASDPDADRLAVAQKVSGKWYQFKGNEVGVLLASHVLAIYRRAEPDARLAMLASTVSTRMLAAMASAENFHFVETLTGFKWLGNRAQDLSAEGYKVVFAFEEALGYMLPGILHDKDSVSALAMFLTAMARWSQEENMTPYEKLQDLYKTYGYFADANTYLISPSVAVTQEIFNNIRQQGAPDPYPTILGSRRILRWRDLTTGYDSATEDKRPELPVSRSSEMITVEVEGGVIFTARASGTEPKIKLYVEACAKDADEARQAADEVVQDLIQSWFPLENYGLKLP